jgi:hypothetical protein
MRAILGSVVADQGLASKTMHPETVTRVLVMRWLEELEVPVTTIMPGERVRLERGELKVRWDGGP